MERRLNGDGLDPELEALPEPRRPYRRLTLATMALTAGLSLAMAWALRAPARFAIWRGPPRELGSLTHVQPGAESANTWVHAQGVLGPLAAEYRRPLDPDRYRLAPVDDNPSVWVELRVPSEIEPEHYVAPNSFVGRLVPLGDAGIRYTALPTAARDVFGRPPPEDAWLLIDGEAPATTRWTLGLVALFLAFAAFNTWGIVRLLRPVDDA